MKKNRWSLIFEDTHLLIVDKPAGYLSIPDRYDVSIPNLKDQLIKYRGEIFVNHRLDKETSGLILFSKTPATHKAFSDLFETHQINKYYKAIVHDQPPLEIGMIDLPLQLSKNKPRKMLISDKGKAAQTKYRILKTWKSYALLEIQLLTGRMHQIRAHLEAIRCPIICDTLYGFSESFYLSNIKKKYRSSRDTVEKPLIDRVALHAYKLSFKHPFTQEDLNFEIKMPKDMRAVINQLDKNNPYQDISRF